MRSSSLHIVPLGAPAAGLVAGGAEVSIHPAPSSAPWHAATPIGLHPISSGVTMNGLRLPEQAVTPAEQLQELGYL